MRHLILLVVMACLLAGNAGCLLNAYPSDTFAISASYPDPTDSTWTVKVENIHPSYFGEVHLTPYVVCLPVG